MTAPSAAPGWFCMSCTPRPAAENMAIDEALLETAASRQRPVLRFYSWSQPAATFGYSQRIANIEALTTLRPLIRRPTGGGLVPHEADWTYSVIVPPQDAWYELSASDSYQRIHEWMAESLNRIGLSAQLASVKDAAGPGQCFVGAEVSDLVVGNRKLAGAAQRRNRLGLLIQGSIQPPGHSFPRTSWEQNVINVGTERWGIAWKTLQFDPHLEERVGRLVREKYSQPEYNRRR